MDYLLWVYIEASASRFHTENSGTVDVRRHNYNDATVETIALTKDTRSKTIERMVKYLSQMLESQRHQNLHPTCLTSLKPRQVARPTIGNISPPQSSSMSQTPGAGLNPRKDIRSGPLNVNSGGNAGRCVTWLALDSLSTPERKRHLEAPSKSSARVRTSSTIHRVSHGLQSSTCGSP